MPDDGPEDGECDGPPAVAVLQNAFPDRLGRIALQQVLGLVVLEVPGLPHPALGGLSNGAGLKLGVFRQSVPAALVEG